ncbi:hypothetical protein COOONC_09221 [Cooperia oncophora]
MVSPDPKDTPPKPIIETKEKKERRRREKEELLAYKLDMIHDLSGKPRGYAFIEYSYKAEMSTPRLMFIFYFCTGYWLNEQFFFVSRANAEMGSSMGILAPDGVLVKEDSHFFFMSPNTPDE